MHKSASIRNIFPFLAWPRPTLALLKGEMSAGVTVGLLMIPQCVAYAAVAGMPLVTGIYAALLPVLVATLWGASQRISTGPTALTALMVMSALVGLAQPGSAEWVNLAVWLAILSGLAQLVLGFARFGWVLNIISAPVLMGFTQAAALLILSSQLPALLGFKGNFVSLASHVWTQASSLHLPDFHAGAVYFGVGSLAFLVLAKRFFPRLPAVVIVMVATAGLSYALGFEQSGGAVVGALPAGLPAFYVPTMLSFDAFSQLLLPVLVITLVSFIETASSAKNDNLQRGKLWDQDQDLIGQGLAKIVSGFSGALATSGSFSRSALNLYAGAQSGWANMVGVAIVLVALLFLTPLMHYIPQAVLATVVVAAIVGLLVPKEFFSLWKISKMEAASAMITFIATILTAPHLYGGIITGLLMSLGYFLYLRLHPRIIEVGLHADGSLRDRHLWHLPALGRDVYALRMDAELDFASSSAFERAIVQHLSAHPNTQHVCLFALPINSIDATGVATFGQIRRSLQSRGITLHISGIKLPVERVLIAAKELPHSNEGEGQDHAQNKEWSLLRLYRTDAEAVAALKHR